MFLFRISQNVCIFDLLCCGPALTRFYEHARKVDMGTETMRAIAKVMTLIPKLIDAHCSNGTLFDFH